MLDETKADKNWVKSEFEKVSCLAEFNLSEQDSAHRISSAYRKLKRETWTTKSTRERLKTTVTTTRTR